MVRARDIKKPVEPEAPPLALAVRRGSALEAASVLFRLAETEQEHQADEAGGPSDAAECLTLFRSGV